MSEELKNISDNDSINNNDNIDNNTSNINEDAPIITYVEDAPKTSALVEENSNSNSNNPEGDLMPETGYNQIIDKEQPNSKMYHWNYNEESDEKINSKNSKETRTKTKKHSNLGLKIFAAAMSILFVISCVSTISMLALRYGSDDNTLSETPVISNNKVPSDNSVLDNLENIDITIDGDKNARVLATPEIIEKVKPSVVGIEVTSEVQSSFNIFGRNNSETYEQQSIGTGFILTADGYIATNYHVIEDAKEVKVTLNSGETYPAEVIGGDEAADIAVIKIDAKNLPVSELGDSDALVQGDDVVAIGTPAGIEFAGTATKGIVSAINRDVEVPVGSGFSSKIKSMTVIQTDASINPGNSGGPLVNDQGQVIGITTMKLSTSYFEGMGFAIPINIAIPVINDIIANPGIKLDTESESAIGYGKEDTSTVSFGVSGVTVTEEESEYYNIPQGWKIGAINEDGPCHNSGIQLSDIIIALDGETVTSYEDMVALKNNYKPNDKVIVTVYRNGDTYDFEVTLAAR